MNLSLSLAPSLRLVMALDGGMLGSCLPRTERILKRHTRAQSALYRVGASSYRSLLDGMLALCSPTWERHVRAYYGDKGPQMVAGWSQATIARVDAVLAHVAAELVTLAADWPAGAYHDRALRDALRTFAGPHLPTTEPGKG
jgi:hypothetical protein